MSVRSQWWRLAIGIPLVIGALLWLGWFAPARTIRGIVQDRQTFITPSLGPAYRVSQTFVAPRDGLSAVEVLVARADAQVPLPPDTPILFMLERLDRPVSALALRLPLVKALRGQHMHFAFAPWKDSGGGVFRLTLAMDEDYGIGVRACAEDALADGAMYANGAITPGDLAFFTYHHFTAVDLGRDLLADLAAWGSAWGALVMLMIPGVALMAWFPSRPSWEVGEIAAIVLAGSLSFWPLLLLWTTAIGWRLGPWGVGAAMAVLMLLAMVGLWRKQCRGESLGVAWGWPESILGILTILTILLRFVQVRDLIVPAWVDSVHHTMVTQLIIEQGVVPRTGEPYINVPAFHYHFGLHANAAVLSWVGGLPAYRSVLFLGQVLAGVAGLPLYSLTVALFKKRTRWARWGGVVAAAVPSFMTYMPAYYASWGRYTQLAGLVILPVLIAETFAWMEGEAPRLGWVWPLGLTAGLALTHYRVLIFYGVFWGVYGVYRFMRAGWRSFAIKARVGPVLQGMALAAVAFLLILPWVLQVIQGAILPFATVYGKVAAPGGGGAFPVDLLKVGRVLCLLLIAGVGWVWGILRRYGRVALLGGWAAACVLLASPQWLGLQGSWIVSGGSAAISYWLPAGVLVGFIVGDVLSLGTRFVRLTQRRLQALVEGALCGGLLAGAIVSLWMQADIINEQTVLLRQADLPAIAWVKENLPDDSLILINTCPWMEGIPMGSDAGWWLPYLAGRQVTYPPVLYTHGEPSYREPIAALAEMVAEATSFDDPAVIQRLMERGVTHVFVGSRGGPLEPSKLHPPHYIEVYRHGPTRVYRFVAAPIE